MARTLEHRTYQRSECVVFRKTNEHFGGLSNMAGGYPLRVNGVRILTSEALYQACRFPHMPDVQRLIIDQPSPMTAKMKSKPHRKQSRPDWDSVNVTVMRWSLRVKLAQNWRKFGELLLETGDRPIVEESVKDEFWGAKPLEDGSLVGANVLGRLLMELREQLRTDPAPLLQVEPPLSGFLLFNKPIEAIIAEVSARELIERASVAPPAAGTPVSKADRSLWELGDEVAATPRPVEPPQPEPVAKADWSSSVIPKECKRLAEVDFPIAAVSAHSAREKSIRHGHPSTLHLWWARRPLAACRSMLMALLLPDPCDANCPAAFKDAARRILLEFPGRPGRWDKELDAKNGKAADAAMRKALLHEFIADFANWDNAANPAYLKTARALVKAAHGDEAPLVVDPFAGGGSIPLEALRIGCDAFASDLNPVACLVQKTALEDLPRLGPRFQENMKRMRREIIEPAVQLLADVYPPDPDGLRPIAYLWARTAQCEAPDCGAEIPLLSSFWLSKKAGRRRAIRHKAVRERGSVPRIEFEIFQPSNEDEVPNGSIKNAKATCIACNRVLLPEQLRSQMSAIRGGADPIFDGRGVRTGGARLMAVVVRDNNTRSRSYRLPQQRDYHAVQRAIDETRRLSSVKDNNLPDVPTEPINPIRPSPNARGLSAVTRYGVSTFGDLFNAREKLSLLALARTVRKAWESTDPDMRALAELAANSLSKRADYASAGTRWHLTFEKTTCTFSKQALSMTWDFVEPTPVGEASGSFGAGLDTVESASETIIRAVSHPGQVQLADACNSPLPDDTAAVWFTDPPYYDAIPYADLSDYFFVWLKRGLPTHPLLRNPFEQDNLLTPKARECVWNQSYVVNGSKKDGKFFEETVAEAFKEGRRVLQSSGIGCIVFAHKTTEGWEALLSGIVQAAWVITASWPIATERPGRLQSQNSAALATSVHLVCRARDEDAGVGDWGEIIRELPKRIGDWMERLSDEGIRGADLVFACIGPALELFSKYARVETPDGEEVGLAANDKARGEPARRGFLSYVWEFAGRTALNQVLGSAESRARNGAAGALEEDARLTALFLWTLQATESAANGKAAKKAAEAEDDEADDADEGDDDGEETGAKKGKKKAGLSLIYDVARRFAQPLGIHLDLWEGRIIETAKGVVRLLPVGERAKQLFGEDGASAVVRRFDSAKKPDPQGMLDFMAEQRAAAVPEVKGRGRKKKDGTEPSPESLRAKREATTLDRVHAAMLLQDSGATNALRALLEAEVERGPDFLRLANALSALYPRDSEEKRLLDAMLLAVPR